MARRFASPSGTSGCSRGCSRWLSEPNEMKPLAPKKPIWFTVSVGVGVLSLAVAIWLRSRRAWDPGSIRSGLGFGIAAAALILSQVLYPLRRRLLAFPFGTAQRWVQFHIYGGVLAFFFVLIHQGFRWPSGTMGWILLVLIFWATFSGLVGVWLEKWIPAMIASGLQVEAIFERIPELIAKLRG